MAYVLEEISKQDQLKILNDAKIDEIKRKRLLARGGHFEENPGLTWAIDREKNSYFFRGPKADITSPLRHYLLFLNNKFYQIFLRPKENWLLSFEVLPQGEILDELEEVLKQVLYVHRLKGRGLDLEPELTFEIEVNNIS